MALPLPISAKEIIYSFPPNLLVGPSRTKKPGKYDHANHGLEFKATLAYWATFEDEVRASSEAVKWDSDPNFIHYAPGGADETQVFPSEPEVWRCGDAHSVLNRFSQNIGHVTGQVFRALQIPVWFGGYKTGLLTSSVMMPDIVMTDEKDRVGAVGEVKAPWILRLTNAIDDDQEIRNALGLLAKYMHIHQVKYAFLTTYNQTIFCKQGPLSTEPGISPTKDQEFALWHSDVIRHNEARASQHVSLRECFLFLGINIRDGDNKCRNTMRLNDWIGKSSGSSNRYGGYISPPDPPGYAERRKRGKGRRAHELLLYARSQGQNVSGPEWLQSQDKLSQSQTEIKYCDTFFEGAESHGVEYLLEEDRNHQGYPILYRNHEGCLFERRGNRLHSVNLPLKESNTIGEWHYEVKGLPYIVDLRELRP